MGIVERVNSIYEYLNRSGVVDSKADFAEKAGYHVSSISGALNGDLRYATEKMLVRIGKSFPGIFNEEWLKTGEGSMLNRKGDSSASGIDKRLRMVMDKLGRVDIEGIEDVDNEEFPISSKISVIQSLCREYAVNSNFILNGDMPMFISESGRDPRVIELPVAPVKASASFVDNLFGDNVEMDTMPVMSLEGESLSPSRHMVFPILGGSMEPTIHSGSMILGERIDEGGWSSVCGIIIIVYNTSLIVKRVKKNALYSSNSLTLRADNPIHGELTVERGEIRGIWKAIRVVTCPID